MVFRVVLTMRVHPGREAEFERTWLAASPTVTGHPANLGQWLARQDGEPATYVITSDWVSEAKFREFESHESHLAHRALLHPLRASGSMTTQHVVHSLTGTAADG